MSTGIGFVSGMQEVAKNQSDLKQNEVQTELLSTKAAEQKLLLAQEQEAQKTALAAKALRSKTLAENPEINLATLQGETAAYEKYLASPDVKSNPELLDHIQGKHADSVKRLSSMAQEQSKMKEIDNDNEFDLLNQTTYTNTPEAWKTLVEKTTDPMRKQMYSEAATKFLSPAALAADEATHDKARTHLLSVVAPMKMALKVQNDLARQDAEQKRIDAKKATDEALLRLREQEATNRRDKLDNGAKIKAKDDELARARLVESVTVKIAGLEQTAPEVPNPKYKDKGYFSRADTMLSFGETEDPTIPNPEIDRLREQRKKLEDNAVSNLITASPTPTPSDPSKVVAKDGKTYKRPPKMSDKEWAAYVAQVGK